MPYLFAAQAAAFPFRLTSLPLLSRTSIYPETLSAFPIFFSTPVLTSLYRLRLAPDVSDLTSVLELTTGPTYLSNAPSPPQGVPTAPPPLAASAGSRRTSQAHSLSPLAPRLRNCPPTDILSPFPPCLLFSCRGLSNPGARL